MADLKFERLKLIRQIFGGGLELVYLRVRFLGHIEDGLMMLLLNLEVGGSGWFKKLIQTFENFFLNGSLVFLVALLEMLLQGDVQGWLIWLQLGLGLRLKERLWMVVVMG